MVEFDQMWFSFQHTVVSPAWVHTLFPSVLQRLNSRGIEVLFLIFEKVLNCRYDLINGPILFSSQVFLFLFSCWGTEIVRWYQIRVIWRVIKQFKGVQSHSHRSHAQQPLQIQTCVLCRNVVLVKQYSFVSFPGRLWNISSTTCQTPELLIRSVGLSGRKQCS